MKRKFVLAAMALLIVAILGWALKPKPVEVETATVTQGRFERSVNENGKTRLRDRYVVSAPLTGRLLRPELREGDRVLAGAVLLTLQPVAPALMDARSRAEQVARVGAAQAGVARARTQVARASAALDQAESELQRNQPLVQEGFISGNQIDVLAMNARLREKELQSVRHEEAAARYELASSQAALKEFSQPADSSNSTPQRTYGVRAPVSGKVLKLLQQSAGMVSAGTPLIELGDPTQLEVVVDILTEDAAQIRPGTAVELTNWGTPDTLVGIVKLIEPAAFTKISALGVEEQRVNVIVGITSPPEKWASLGDGFKIDVRLLVQEVENAVQVPVSAVFPVGAKSGVFVLEDGQAHLKTIDTVARNGVMAWVKADLSPGTHVIVYPDTKLKDGDPVKPR